MSPQPLPLALTRPWAGAVSLLLASVLLGCQHLGGPSTDLGAGHGAGYAAAWPQGGAWPQGASGYAAPSPYGSPQAPAQGAPPSQAAGAAGWSAGREALASQAVAFARAQLGKPYCWGGTGPGCFDCSGLVHAAWRAAGLTVPRSSGDQAAKLGHLPLGLAAPGDIVWREGHVGLYVGDGLVIHAPRTGKTVTMEAASHYQLALRP